ncbi:hypothetical protein SDC9_191673 [bioreactor metagenome]|uniref:Uncharacterized protein n=1 Tax=bioreactor metagenome TaxID=1076179 RepID=A0A645I045_9ZZZZ
MIIVPIGKLNLFRDRFFDLFRNLGTRVVVVLFLVCIAEIHVRPDDRFQLEFVADAADPVQMAVVNTEGRLVSVNIHEPAASEVVRFVHAQMYPARLQRLAPERDHFFEKLIRFRFIDQNNIGGIRDRSIRGPAQDRFQMSERLNRSNDLDLQGFGIRVHFLHLFFGIGAAHVAEVGFARNLIGVFRVEHRHVVAHQ